MLAGLWGTAGFLVGDPLVWEAGFFLESSDDAGVTLENGFSLPKALLRVPEMELPPSLPLELPSFADPLPTELALVAADFEGACSGSELAATFSTLLPAPLEASGTSSGV